MKKIGVLLFAVLLLQGCASDQATSPGTDAEPQKPPVAEQPQTPAEPSEQPSTQEPQSPDSTTGEGKKDSEKQDVYANDLFRQVTVKKTGTDTFEVKGQAQVFEGVVSYVVEDGHNELVKGSIQTSAGAPAWGDFTHTLTVKKADPNTTLTLILFETSAKDGSRRSELILPLPE
ncbi:Gmad2 immunoglobulin-like domain-containing protein [Brevibacillus brevis]|uniref:Gmad2 immunoglobulin-like domain-containing protein n=1 Tax=Brevibacillus brevis TaxID=1393 RepID=A0ABY9SY66_BREBE|nr:Gmad2 immunoglobulin-like domain-containing protein [Brevibacillus brevis]WNC12663.1 Gmad2 immunoglobulin-like domain-containing protein [Brevibacillus brevis]